MADAGKLAMPLPNAGELVSVTLSVRPACNKDQPVNVQVEVYDPDNQLVAHTTTPPTADRPETTVKFTAALPGAYHLSARFDPELGQAQADLLVAQARTEPPVFQSESTTRNLTVDLLPGGEWLGFDAVALRLTSSAGVQSVPALGFSRSGSVVWTRDSTGVFRYLLDGGVLVRAPLENLAPFTSSFEASLAVTQSSAFAMEIGKVISAEVGDGGRQSVFKTSVAAPVVAAIGPTGVRAAVSASAWCQFTSPFSADGGACFPAEGTPVGQEEGRVWLHDKLTNSVVVATPGDAVDLPPHTGRLRLPAPLTVISTQPIGNDAVLPGRVPLIGDPANKLFSWVPRVADGGIILERYVGVGARAVDASSTHVRAAVSDGGFELFAR